MPALKAEVITDLKKSGLTLEDAKKLKITMLTATQTKQLTKHTTEAYKLPYFDLTGRPTGFYRLRYQKPPQPFKAKKPVRYWQPTGTLPQLYLPPLGVKWVEVARDAERDLYITEGEKKAACATKRGFPCVGLGGVWSWRSKRADVPLIEDFKLITWKNRRVIFVFDSDTHENVSVQVALVALARELIKLGARPLTVKLPSGQGGAKAGFDDFLVERGAKEFAALDPYPLIGRLADELWKLNEELAYIEESAGALVIKTEKLVNRQLLTGMVYANRNVVDFVDDKAKELNCAVEWLKWAHRRTHRRLAYQPGEERVTAVGDYNLWSSWGVEPKKGDVTLWAQLMEYVFRSSPQHHRWFLQWLAYPLQHPGTKLYVASVLFSLHEGVGKSLVGMTLGKIYGQNFSLVSQDDITSQFNDWAVNKQFILGDEINGIDKREHADRLKNLVTRELIRVNEKHQPKYVIEDRMNYLFTTNHPDAFIVGDNDRRYFIHEIEGAPLTDEFYLRYDAWLRGDGPAALFYHLLTNIDVSEFNPKARAPVTEAKREMAELSKSDLDLWVAAIRADPDEALRLDNQVIKRELWTISELLTLFDPDGRKRTSKIALTKALRRARYKELPVTNTCHGSKRLWALRSEARWRAADHDTRMKSYNEAHRASVVDEKKAKF